jgi:Ca-activated chloride channel family protein
MSFMWPSMLLLALAIPVGVALYLVRDRRRRHRIAEFGPLAAVAGQEHSAPGPNGRLRRRIPAVLFVAGLTILVLAVARPQSVVSVPRVEGTVILSFDVSGSMAADDIAPTRMEAAKAAARGFVERQPASMLIGVVAFSDSGFSIQVPTDDQALVLAAIDRLDPERGTSLARGILTSLTTIEAADDDPAAGYYTNRSPEPTPVPTPVPEGTYASAAIILLSDGENNQQPDPLEAASVAADRGVRIYTVGIGSLAGATLEVEGFKVHSQLDEAMLRHIADITDGTYYAADEPAELSAIYDTIDTRLVIRPEPMEVTSLFAGAGVLLLLVGGIASLTWLGRLP